MQCLHTASKAQTATLPFDTAVEVNQVAMDPRLVCLSSCASQLDAKLVTHVGSWLSGGAGCLSVV